MEQKEPFFGNTYSWLKTESVNERFDGRRNGWVPWDGVDSFMAIRESSPRTVALILSERVSRNYSRIRTQISMLHMHEQCFARTMESLLPAFIKLRKLKLI